MVFMKNYFIATIISLISGVPLFAQHMSTPVMPGSKGALPTVASVPSGDGSVLPLLSLKRIYTYASVFGGSFSYVPTIECRFPPASTLGGDYYLVEMLKSREWVTKLYDYEEPCQCMGDNFSLKKATRKNGWTTNVPSRN